MESGDEGADRIEWVSGAICDQRLLTYLHVESFPIKQSDEASKNKCQWQLGYDVRVSYRKGCSQEIVF